MMKIHVLPSFGLLTCASLWLFVSPALAADARPGADALASAADTAAKAGAEAMTADRAAENVPTTEDEKALKLRLAAGLNLRTDLGVHSTRLDFAARYHDYELDLVLDPMFWTNGQVHSDLLVQWHSGVGFSAFTGYRLSLIPLLDGPQSQHTWLLGLGADLPRFLGGFLRGQAGFELATTLVKAGGGLPAEYISFESGRSYIDLVNMALFIRLNTGLDL